MTKYIITAIVVVVVLIGGFLLITNLPGTTTTTIPENGEDVTSNDDNGDTTTGVEGDDVNGGDVNGGEPNPTTVLGTSVEGNEITAHHYPAKGGADANIDVELLFVGGIHGGYSWNTALVSYEMMDYLDENPNTVPENIRVTVIPVLNPDGLSKTVGTTGRFTRASVPSSQSETIPGRFNANDVDLNRNFDCDWQADATWQDRSVSGGTSAFSEPEAKALRDYVNSNNPDAVVVWYSAAGGVFSSNCHNGVLDETRTITNVYADGSGYPAHEEFDFYEITGDATNWLAKNNIPAISVLLTTHQDVEWQKNKAGIEALFEHYSN